jgi:hypothetical protein
MQERYIDYTAILEKGAAKAPEIQSFHDGYVFRVDYSSDTPEAVLRNDMLTYLAEYRLEVKKTAYELTYSRGALRSADDGEAMTTIGKNGITERIRQGKSVKKETADLLGMQRIEQYMAEAEEGDSIAWASPPDPTVGYEYGFIYFGTVEKADNDNKKLKMNAVRLDENPSLQQFSEALSLLTQKSVEFTTVNECISNPQYIRRNIPMQEIDFILRGTFAFTADEQEEQRKKRVLKALSPYIDEWVERVGQDPSYPERRRYVNTLENLTREFDRRFTEVESISEETIFDMRLPNGSLADLQEKYGYVPPKIVGSCDDAGAQGTSPDILGYNSIFSSVFSMDSEKTLSCTCPFCNKKVDAIIKDGKITCPRGSCGKSASYTC